MRKIISSLQLALHALRSNIFRTFLSVLGIVIGVGALVTILSLIDGMEQHVRGQIAQTSSLNAIALKPEVFRSTNGVRMRKDSVAVIDHTHFRSLEARLGNAATLYLRATATDEVMLTPTSKPIGVYRVATMQSLEPDATATAGKLFSPDIVTGALPVAVVNEAFVEAAALSNTAAIGQSFTLGKKTFTIQGVLKSKNNIPHVYIPVTTLPASELQANPPEVYAMVNHTEEIPRRKDEITQWLAVTFHHHKDDYSVNTNEYRVAQAAQGFLLFRVIMGLIVGISVVVGGIGVMNVLLISVTERTVEIGIRKALGAKRIDIVMLFLAESVTVSAFGSAMGLLLGIAASLVIVPIINAIVHISFHASFTGNTFLIITGVAMLIGIVFGTYPALRASRLDPVEAIRHT